MNILLQLMIIDTRVLDDALSFQKLANGNSIFRVHIADPLAIIPYDSNTFKEAKKRVATIYNRDDSINMLPLVFSADKLSLNENKERYAKTFCYVLDSDYNIIDFYILNTVIKVSERLSYDSLNKLYKKGGITKEEDEMLIYYDNILNSLKSILSQVKNYHELKEKIGNRHSKKNSSFSETLVSYSMILTGYMTSKYFSIHNLPYIYRCNNLDSNWIELLDKTINNSSNVSEQKRLKIIKNNLTKSYYSDINVGHNGLDLESYSHTTSPLRKFCDVFNMYLLNTCYFNNSTDRDIYNIEDEIKQICKHLNMQNNTIDDYIKSKSKIK